MAIKLKKKKNLAKQFKEMAVTLVDDAQKFLEQRSKVEGVHNARKVSEIFALSIRVFGGTIGGGYQ